MVRVLTKVTGCGFRTDLLTGYGCYCGWGGKDSYEPIDDFDAACMVRRRKNVFKIFIGHEDSFPKQQALKMSFNKQ